MTSPVKRFLSNLVIGLLAGIIYYLVFTKLLPYLLSEAAGIFSVSQNVVPENVNYTASFIVLMALAIIERVLENPIVAAFRVLSKLVASLLLYVMTNGGVFTIVVGGEASTLAVTLDLSLLIYSLIILSVIAGIVDAGSAIIKYSSS